jgi:hypothetical protein
MAFVKEVFQGMETLGVRDVSAKRSDINLFVITFYVEFHTSIINQ